MRTHWTLPNSSSGGKTSLQKKTGAIKEFYCQWNIDIKPSYVATHRYNYIKLIKDEAGEDGTILIHMDFAENHTLLVNKEMMQAHWEKQQATLFTIHLKVAKDIHPSTVMISDYLAHDVEFVHAAQGIISEYVRSAYPAVKRLSTSKTISIS